MPIVDGVAQTCCIKTEGGRWLRPDQVLMRVEGAVPELISNAELLMATDREFADATFLRQFSQEMVAAMGLLKFRCADMMKCISRPGCRGDRPDGLLNRPTEYFDMLYGFLDTAMSLDDVEPLWELPMFRVRQEGGDDSPIRLARLSERRKIIQRLPSAAEGVDDLNNLIVSSNALLILHDAPKRARAIEFLATVGIVKDTPLEDVCDSIIFQHLQGEFDSADEVWSGLDFLRRNFHLLLATRRLAHAAQPPCTPSPKRQSSWKKRALEIIQTSRAACSSVGSPAATRSSDEATFRELQLALCAPNANGMLSAATSLTVSSMLGIPCQHCFPDGLPAPAHHSPSHLTSGPLRMIVGQSGSSTAQFRQRASRSSTADPALLHTLDMRSAAQWCGARASTAVPWASAKVLFTVRVISGEAAIGVVTSAACLDTICESKHALLWTRGEDPDTDSVIGAQNSAKLSFSAGATVTVCINETKVFLAVDGAVCAQGNCASLGVAEIFPAVYLRNLGLAEIDFGSAVDDLDAQSSRSHNGCSCFVNVPSFQSWISGAERLAGLRDGTLGSPPATATAKDLGGLRSWEAFFIACGSRPHAAVCKSNHSWTCLSRASCSICMETLLNGSTGMLGCSHIFHEDCIASWLSSAETCPICRAAAAVTEIVPVARAGNATERELSESLSDVLARLNSTSQSQSDPLLLNMLSAYSQNPTTAAIVSSCQVPTRTGFVMLKDTFIFETFGRYGGDMLPYILSDVLAWPDLSAALSNFGVGVHPTAAGLVKALKLLATGVATDSTGHQIFGAVHSTR